MGKIVTFDSNVYRQVVSPEKFPSDSDFNNFMELKQAIINKKNKTFSFSNGFYA